MELASGKYVKMGEYSLKFDATMGDPRSGSQSVVKYSDYYRSPRDYTQYDQLYMWLYSSSTSAPVLRLYIRNEGVWSAGVHFSGEVQNGWGVVNADISSFSRDAVGQLLFSVFETDYGVSESITFYFDSICLVSTTADLSMDLQNTDEDLTESESFGLRQVPFPGGRDPSFVLGRPPREFAIIGIIPTTTTESALLRESQLEDLCIGTNSYFLHTDICAMPVRVISYTSTIGAGAIDSIAYTLGLAEDFGEDKIVR